MNHLKAILVSAAVTAVTMAVLFRIGATKKLIAPTLP